MVHPLTQMSDALEYQVAFRIPWLGQRPVTTSVCSTYYRLRTWEESIYMLYKEP